MRVKHSAVVASLVGFFLACTALILITVESDDRDLDVPYPSPRIAMLQGRQQVFNPSYWKWRGYFSSTAFCLEQFLLSL